MGFSDWLSFRTGNDGDNPCYLCKTTQDFIQTFFCDQIEQADGLIQEKLITQTGKECRK